MAHTMWSTCRWDTAETGPAPGQEQSPEELWRLEPWPWPGVLAGTHLSRMEVGLCRQHVHHVGSQLGAVGTRGSHALDGGEEDAQAFRRLQVLHEDLWEEGQHVSHREGCDGPAQPCCSQRPRRAGSRGWAPAGVRPRAGPVGTGLCRGQRRSSCCCRRAGLSSGAQGSGLRAQGSGLALLTMNILLLLLSSESRKDSRARQLCQPCGCSASWSHSLVPGEKRTQCLSAGGPGELAVAAGGSGTSLPGRKGACQSRAGGSAAREGPGSRAQGRGNGSSARGKAAGLARSLARVSPAEERGPGGLVLAWLCPCLEGPGPTRLRSLLCCVTKRQRWRTALAASWLFPSLSQVQHRRRYPTSLPSKAKRCFSG